MQYSELLYTFRKVLLIVEDKKLKDIYDYNCKHM